MKAIYLKELQSFFSNLTGYLVIGVFLTLNGLFLWVFNTGYNILDFGFANLTPFFTIAPWIFIFLIPAISMRSFSEEKKQGTLELLLTKPISQNQLVWGKYLGVLTISLMAILPTTLYVFSIYQLGKTPGNADFGALFTSYIGLVLLSATYAAISLFCSSISKNQIMAFMASVLLLFIFFVGLDNLEGIHLLGNQQYDLTYLGINYHYKSISRGVIDTRDLIYFFSIIALFIFLTRNQIRKEIA
ncbi:gliding motility-associated ABC transporter permease subunit GldF [uncultured Mesonia sp.]|uniref:gliding motility-associated ABC transporter permease subunit GldF n=1 Tax=uncultured Mesonia sp. TaxID=399731 RepID=UPI00374F4992